MSIVGRISSIELRDLLLSLVALVVAFSVLMNGKRIPGLETILIITVGVGTGFLLHEMAHKFVALHFGYFAEYRANRMGLLFAVAASFAGFIFAAPGAVMISKPTATQEFYMQDSFGQEELRQRDKKGDSLDIPGRAHDQHRISSILLSGADVRPIERHCRSGGQLRLDLSTSL